MDKARLVQSYYRRRYSSADDKKGDGRERDGIPPSQFLPSGDLGALRQGDGIGHVTVLYAAGSFSVG
jgi:hypothetical protein